MLLSAVSPEALCDPWLSTAAITSIHPFSSTSKHTHANHAHWMSLGKWLNSCSGKKAHRVLHDMQSLEVIQVCTTVWLTVMPRSGHSPLSWLLYNTRQSPCRRSAVHKHSYSWRTMIISDMHRILQTWFSHLRGWPRSPRGIFSSQFRSQQHLFLSFLESCVVVGMMLVHGMFWPTMQANGWLSFCAWFWSISHWRRTISSYCSKMGCICPIWRGRCWAWMWTVSWTVYRLGGTSHCFSCIWLPRYVGAFIVT